LKTLLEKYKERLEDQKKNRATALKKKNQTSIMKDDISSPEIQKVLL